MIFTLAITIITQLIMLVRAILTQFRTEHNFKDCFYTSSYNCNYFAMPDRTIVKQFSTEQSLRVCFHAMVPKIVTQFFKLVRTIVTQFITEQSLIDCFHVNPYNSNIIFN